MKGRFCFGVLAISLTLMATSRTSAAQGKPTKPAKTPASASAPQPAPRPSLTETLSGDAKSDYEAGKLLYGDGDFAGALVKFESAYDKANDPRLLWNIAACEKNLRHYASVLRYVRKYLSEGGDALNAADREEAEALLGTIEPFTAGLELAASEPGASVYVDDVLAGTTPFAKPIVVDLGMRKIRVVKDGFEEFAKELPIGGAKIVRLEVPLKKIVHEGTLAVDVRPGQEIFVDGVRVGVGGWRGVVPSGGHMLRVTAPEMRAYQSEIVVRDNETRNVAITLDKEIKPSAGVPAWVWIGGGVLAVAGASLGAYFLFKPEDRQPTVPVGTLEPGNVQASIPSLRFR